MYSLTKEELEVSRTPLKAYRWCLSLIEKIASTDKGTEALRMRQGLCKELLEEVYPTVIWAKGTYGESKEVKIKPMIGSQNFDAFVSDSRGGTKTEFPIEVTQAHMGQSEHLRMLHLASERWAPGPLSEMSKEGTKNTGMEIKPGRVLNSMDGLVQKTLELLSVAVRRKISKSYPSDTRLLVTFEDFSVAKENSIEQTLLSMVNDMDRMHKFTFPFIYLVGMSEKLLITYESGS